MELKWNVGLTFRKFNVEADWILIVQFNANCRISCQIFWLKWKLCQQICSCQWCDFRIFDIISIYLLYATFYKDCLFSKKSDLLNYVIKISTCLIFSPIIIISIIKRIARTIESIDLYTFCLNCKRKRSRSLINMSPAWAMQSLRMRQR